MKIITIKYTDDQPESKLESKTAGYMLRTIGEVAYVNAWAHDESGNETTLIIPLSRVQSVQFELMKVDEKIAEAV